jgi:gamma-glutamyltranspeptidase/glutathione hydrolase
MKKKIFAAAFFLAASNLSAKPIIATHAMVTSISREANEAGLKIIKSGGNAADAAVATAFSLAVTRPYFGSIGGGGFMLMKFKGHPVEALDHREHAPEKSSSNMFLTTKNGDASETGGLAVAIPGSVAGLFALHEKYGKLKWEKLLQPAIDLASKGFIVSYEFSQITKEENARLSKAALKHLTTDEKTFPQTGTMLKQPALAKALKLIQKNKAQGFYTGEVANDLVQSISASGGIVSLSDLKNYKVRWLLPLKTTFNDHLVYTMPPPSSGGVFLVELLGLSKRLSLKNKKPLSADEFHIMGEAMARVASARSLLGDPDFNKLSLSDFLSGEHLDRLSKSINENKKTAFTPDPPLGKSQAIGESHEGHNTSHFCVVDQEGQVVSATLTLNGAYGSGVVTTKFGIALNNEMDDFNTKPGKPNMFGLMQGATNNVEPGKTPLSSMTPTIVFDQHGQFELALGSPGGPRIISAVYQVLYHALTTDWDLEQVITAPRVHHQYHPDTLYYDQFGFSPDTLNILTSKGHKVSPATIARVYAIRRTKEGLLEGAWDPRAEGYAEGF